VKQSIIEKMSDNIVDGRKLLNSMLLFLWWYLV